MSQGERGRRELAVGGRLAGGARSQLHRGSREFTAGGIERQARYERATSKYARAENSMEQRAPRGKRDVVYHQAVDRIHEPWIGCITPS